MKASVRSTLRQGFTLIEILIVSMIIVVVASIVLVLYQTVDSVRLTQNNITDTSAALGQAMRLMSRDLSCSYGTGQEGAEFILTAAEERDRTSSTLGFTASLRDVAEEELDWSTTEVIRYYVDRVHYPEPTLLRVSHNLNGPETGRPAVTNELVRNVRLFNADVYDGEKWKNEWSSRDEEGLPEAIQFSIEMETGATTTTQRMTKVYIAAGNLVKP